MTEQVPSKELVSDADLAADLHRYRNNKGGTIYRLLFELQERRAAHEPPVGQDIQCWVEGSTFKWSTDGGGERQATSGELVMWAEIERLRAAQPPEDGWTAVTERLPAFTEDQREFVLVYSETHDWMGTQFAVMRVADFYFYDPDCPEEMGTADADVVTHWKPLNGPTLTKSGDAT